MSDERRDYVVMLDFQFLGIHVLAENEEQARVLVIAALDNLHTGREPTGITGIEYGLRNTKVLPIEEKE